MNKSFALIEEDGKGKINVLIYLVDYCQKKLFLKALKYPKLVVTHLSFLQS